MTNDQRLEVAIKIWEVPIELGEMMPHDHIVLKEKMESWTGFGRTVEAMADRGLYFFNIPNEIKHTDYRKVIFRKLSNRDIKKLIEATHLAALEAIDAEK